MKSDGAPLGAAHSDVGPQGISRRSLLVGTGVAGAGAATVAMDPSVARSGPLPSTTGEHRAERPSVVDFGAIGDGKTDDSQAIQKAVDWAARHPGTALHIPARIFGLRRPLLVPGELELAGEVPGSGNHPVCGFRALPGFESDLIQRYWSDGVMQSMQVAALLVCREWTENADFARRLHIRDLFFDIDARTDTRGAPIHGLLLSNQQLDLHNVWVRHPTGHGVWINTQTPNGKFVRPIVDNVLRRVWIRGAGIGNATYSTEHGTQRFAGILIGALPGARDHDGRSEPALATDGILDYCTVAVGPEKGLGSRGDGIFITQAAGWRVSACHINGAGRHGIGLHKAYQTEISGCYVDGWGTDAELGEGSFGGIWCTSAISLGQGAEGGVLIASNRIRARGVRSASGNRFAAIGLTAGSRGTPRGIVSGNVVSRRRDTVHAFAAFRFGRSREGELEALVVGNAISGADRIFLHSWDESVVRPRFTGNNFQHAAAPPTSGWHPSGLRIENTFPRPGGWSGWVNIEAGRPGAWKGAGPIEA